jgi:hypothetical protein
MRKGDKRKAKTIARRERGYVREGKGWGGGGERIMSDVM